jgi:hypothetical protein
MANSCFQAATAMLAKAARCLSSCFFESDVFKTRDLNGSISRRTLSRRLAHRQRRSKRANQHAPSAIGERDQERQTKQDAGEARQFRSALGQEHVEIRGRALPKMAGMRFKERACG